MGQILSAWCECGFGASNLWVGGGRHSFQSYCGVPALCKACQAFGVYNYLDFNPKCGRCGGKVSFYNEPDLYQTPDEGKQQEDPNTPPLLKDERMAAREAAFEETARAGYTFWYPTPALRSEKTEVWSWNLQGTQPIRQGIKRLRFGITFLSYAVLRHPSQPPRLRPRRISRCHPELCVKVSGKQASEEARAEERT